MSYTYKYPHMAVTVDVVLFALDPDGAKVLLIQRKNEPFKGDWAFPGGFVDMDETAVAAARRELAEETGVAAPELTFLGYFDAIDRDPRERTLALAFLGKAASSRLALTAGDDAAATRWFRIDDLPPLAFDHADIMDAALPRLSG
jgi:8-oxo-dGTP diphosphatase